MQITEFLIKKIMLANWVMLSKAGTEKTEETSRNIDSSPACLADWVIKPTVGKKMFQTEFLLVKIVLKLIVINLCNYTVVSSSTTINISS